MVKEKWINDGSVDGAIAYFCECENCRFWEMNRQKVERIEQLHLKKRRLIEELNKKLIDLQKQEAEILGLEIVEVETI